MKQKISKLSETVINQIAAGEVVENPASIVKELIENSLDAQARHISIDIVSGGQQLIRIEDDGCGMSREDALLCLERHATSKIRSVDDLQSLTTMGFRGEALAAIASVSHFELKTSNGTGTRVVAEGGQIIHTEPCARNLGTTIEIRSLFYNVPARKKFQKSPATNAAQVKKGIEIIALAHPEIHFSFNGEKFEPTSAKKRIEDILGPHEHEVKGEGIIGWIGTPEQAMATRSGQYIFINRRPISSPLIAKAVKQGFGTRIPEQTHPRFVLFLELSPDLIDVNVHPQKKEVRFRDEGAVFRKVQKAVEEAFTPAVNFLEPISFSQPSPFSFAEEFPPLSFKEAEAELDLFFHDKPLALIGRYLLLQKEHLLLVDLSAAKSRILFESLKSTSRTAQTLLWPLEIEIEKEAEETQERLAEMGIECRLLKRTLVIDALPPLLEPEQFPSFFASWREDRNTARAVTKLCKSAKKIYSLEEAHLVWRQLQKCIDPIYDPLGKVIWIELKPEDLERWMTRESKN